MIFVIFSCKKRLHLANQLYDMLESIPNVFVAYGDSSSTEMFRIVNKYIILKVGDEYEDLSSKTSMLIKAMCWLFPGQGLVKCDDDIIPCIPDLKKKLALLASYHYAGLVQKMLKPVSSSHHVGKTKDRRYDYIKLTTPKCSYAAGPMYYLSSDAMKYLDRTVKYYNFYEDVFVGFNLNQIGVVPFQIDLYTDTFSVPLNMSYHNSKKKIYCKLHGGLGNQLFQVASCFGLAAKHGRVLILVIDTKNSTHNTSPTCYLESVFRNFNSVKDARLQTTDVYEETDNVQCFKVNEVVGENDLFVKAYLQNEDYFKNYDVRRIFIQPELTAQALQKYPLAPSSIFIHVRRGDYVDNPLYVIDYDTYYLNALKVAKATHYYIVTNDVAYCRTYAPFQDLNATVVDDSPLNTLYLMTVCAGGICSNSSFSWWGGYLNETPGKVIVFPNHWINNGAETNIRFEGSIGV